MLTEGVVQNSGRLMGVKQTELADSGELRLPDPLSASVEPDS